MSDDRYKVQVLDCTTGEEYERDMTQEEIDALPPIDADPLGA